MADGYTREGEESDCEGFVKAYAQAIQDCLDKVRPRTSTAPLPWPRQTADE